MPRRTRIVATLGPATDQPGVLEHLFAVGLDVARINFSHGSAQEHRGRIERVRALSETTGHPVAIMADLPGPKLRVLLAAALELKASKEITIALSAGELGDLRVTEPEGLARAQPGQRVLLDDGRLQARVAQVRGDRIVLTVEIGGLLLPNKGANFPDTDLAIPAVTSRDRDAISAALAAGVDWLALSFVREPEAAHALRDVLHRHGQSKPILAKIERPEAVERAEEIIRAFDGIMVARGDLGVEIPLEKVPHVQKTLIAQARLAGKPVITATDMLDSMRNNPRPTRAEASDVANAVYDGTDAVMLSGETAAGQYPVEAITCMDNIVREAETSLALHRGGDVAIPRSEVVDHVSYLTCILARDVKASAIITPTLTGRTARLVARHRPESLIVAVSRSAHVVRELAMVWGVRSVQGNAPVQPGEDRIAAAVQSAFDAGAIKAGDRVVVQAGHPIEGGLGFPTIRVCHVEESGASGPA